LGGDVKVFISWSGSRSKDVAVALRGWLRSVIQSLEPWSSNTDINPGTRWNHDIAEKLQDSQVGILCVTQANVSSPWLNFEAGALSKAVSKARVIPYLIDLKTSDVPANGPLPQFQSVTADKQGTLGMMRSINSSLSNPDGPEQLLISPDLLESSFERFWPDLENKLVDIHRRANRSGSRQSSEPDLNTMIPALLDGVRDIQRRVSALEQDTRIQRNFFTHFPVAVAPVGNPSEPEPLTQAVEFESLASLNMVVKGQSSISRDMRSWIIENLDLLQSQLLEGHSIIVVRSASGFSFFDPDLAMKTKPADQ
jgi:hypothetical protein